MISNSADVKTNLIIFKANKFYSEECDDENNKRKE